MASEILWLEAGHGIAVAGPTLIQLWETVQPDAVRMSRVGDLFRELAAKHPAVFMVTLVGELSPMPDADARAVASSFPKLFKYYVGIHEGSSFRMSIVRSVLVGMSLMSGLRARYDVTDSVEDGMRLLATNAKGEVDAEHVLAVMQRLRTAVRGVPP
jgi:hypothetical protein